jgi:O-methyltransferase
MSTAANIRRSLVRYAYPALASCYHSRSQKQWAAPLLQLLGIADPSYRKSFYTLCRIVEEMAPQRGLYAECGVYRGSTLLGMAHRLRARGVPGWHVIGFDSFEGFPEPARQDALPDGSYHARALKGVFADTSYAELRRKVRALRFEQDITLVKGYFETTLPAWRDKEFTVVHLDCDLYQSYVTCLEFFYPRVKTGGYIVFDEYALSATVYPGAQKAIDGFLANKLEKIESFSESASPRYFIVKQ